jgi:hypothetical protein
VQGLRRHVALLLDPDGTARLVKVRDGEEVVLGEAPGAAPYYEPLRFRLAVQGQSVIASVGRAALRCDIGDALLSSGAIAVCCEDGRVDCLGVHIAPPDDDH